MQYWTKRRHEEKLHKKNLASQENDLSISKIYPIWKPPPVFWLERSIATHVTSMKQLPPVFLDRWCGKTEMSDKVYMHVAPWEHTTWDTHNNHALPCLERPALNQRWGLRENDWECGMHSLNWDGGVLGHGLSDWLTQPQCCDVSGRIWIDWCAHQRWGGRQGGERIVGMNRIFHTTQDGEINTWWKPTNTTNLRHRK